MSTTTTPPTTVTTSKRWTLNLLDFGKGLIVAVLSGILPIIVSAAQTAITGKHLVINWDIVEAVAIFSAGGYLLKNLGSPSQTIVTPPPSNITITK